MTRFPFNPERLSWAHERAGLDALTLAGQGCSGDIAPGEETYE